MTQSISHENISTQPAQNLAIWVDFILQNHPLLPLKQGYLTPEITHRLLQFDIGVSTKISQKKLLPELFGYSPFFSLIIPVVAQHNVSDENFLKRHIH